jgi:1-deoxy-D-xylulose-5-phosphate reductoisomerase
MKGLAILGSTGSIGTQTLEVISELRHAFKVEVLTAGKNWQLLAAQALQFEVNAVVIADETGYTSLKHALEPYPIKVFCGEAAIRDIVEMASIDLVVAAMVGYAGLSSTLHAIANKKHIALANKETLVVAGELITQMAFKQGVSLFPIDSEHSAIFQCLAGEWENPIESLILTASGGPFRGFTKLQLRNVTKTQALKHPNWNMGHKITIDSASLMNKGLEVIEARWLFNVMPEQIKVVIHRQSIIHSMVQFKDGSIKAQLGLPDMKIPIQYALTYPQRLPNTFERFDFSRALDFTFETPDLSTFPHLQIAYDALNAGGLKPCIINAANEVLVDAFLNDQISFYDMANYIERSFHFNINGNALNIDDIKAADAETRIRTRELLKSVN